MDSVEGISGLHAGEEVNYRGGIPQQPHRFDLDSHHAIETGKVFPVCVNTFRMLQQTRFAPHFTFIGDDKSHFGLLEGCGSTIPFHSATSTNGGSFTPEGTCC